MTRRTAAVLAVLAVAAAVLGVVRMAEATVTEDLVSRVDRLAIPGSWTLESDLVRSERFACLDTNPCPGVHRSWTTGEMLSIDDLTALGVGAGFEMKPKGTCDRRPNIIGPMEVCSSEGSDGEYDYVLYVRSPGMNEPHEVVLLVEPSD
jgi:hypothetical protein